MKEKEEVVKEGKPSRTVQISDKDPTTPEAKVGRLKRRRNKITSGSPEQKRFCE